MPQNIALQSAKSLASALRRGKFSSRQLLDLYLARIEKYNPKLNAIIAMDVDAARKRARQADAALKKGTVWGPLHGLPMTIKESFDVAGMATTWGLPELKDHRAARNALAVQRYIDAGAIVFGKTNVPTMLADWQTFNDIYGTTNNPWDVTRVPGGSSGGSAAALAAGLTGLDTGSDIGASIRDPAHYCGVYGHKPTYGICATEWSGSTRETGDAGHHRDRSARAQRGRSRARVEDHRRSRRDRRPRLAARITGLHEKISARLQGRRDAERRQRGGR